MHYLNGSSVVKDEEVTSITASSNCAGRTVPRMNALSDLSQMGKLCLWSAVW